LNCPYCQSNIKSENELQYCKECGTPHHKECWEENGGCTTYGCGQNPHSEKSKINVGNLTVEQIKELNQGPVSQTYSLCFYCSSKIETDSVYCKYCGNKVTAHLPEENTKDFVKEYERRYQSKLKKRKIRYISITAIITVAVILTALVSYYTYIYILNNYFSEEAKIYRFVSRWEKAWESKDINKYKNLLDKDYLYIDNSGERIGKDERMKRISMSFKNISDIELELSNFEIAFDTTDNNYVNVKFLQKYISEKINEEGIKTLRLYRGEDTKWEWRIYREYFDSIKN
jgi:hypothetical protein